MAEIIVGMQAFEEKLNALELSIRGKVLIEAAKAGAQIVVDAARANAPRDRGDMAEGMTMRVSNKESDNNEATVDVGPGKKQFYGHMVERGTSHSVAQPFLGPAIETNRERITAVMSKALLEAIEKVAT